MPQQPVDDIDALVAANLAAREAALSPWAARSAESRGRERHEVRALPKVVRRD